MCSPEIEWEVILEAFAAWPSSQIEPVDAKGRDDNIADELVAELANVIAQYRVSGPVDKWESVGRSRVEATIRFYVSRNKPVRMVLPAFPFKSPNIEDKVISKLPDLATELALSHLNGLAATMSEIYAPGAYILIVPDGIVYNDILGVSDADVWHYADEVQNTLQRLNLTRLCFVPLHRIFEGVQAARPTCQEYCQLVNDWRERLFTEWLPNGYCVDGEIKENPDALATYRGYCKFLALDMAATLKHLSSNKRRTVCSNTAKQMIRRGKCFSRLVATIPHHVRLSIHPCENTSKISVSLFPGKMFHQRTVTPWHNTVVVDSNTGTYRVTTSGLVGKAYTVVCKRDRPWYLCNQPPLLSVRSETELLYPHGIKITCPDEHTNALLDLTDYQTIRQLTIVYGMVVMVGFKNVDSELLCASSASPFSSTCSSSSRASSTTGTDAHSGAGSSSADSILSLSSRCSSNASSYFSYLASDEITTDGCSSIELKTNGPVDETSEAAASKVSEEVRNRGASIVVLQRDQIRQRQAIASLRLAKEHVAHASKASFNNLAQRTNLFRDRRHTYYATGSDDRSTILIYDSEQCVSA